MAFSAETNYRGSEYTEEEMAYLIEMGVYTEADFWGGGQDKAGLQGAMSGAASGAAIGSAGGPAGIVAGAGVGFVAGGITGELSFQEEQDAMAAAALRDMELEKELDAVDNLEQYLTSTNVANAGVRQQGTVEARQAAARGGLGEAQGQAFAQSSASAADLSQSKRLAAAIPAAGQADIMEKRMILEEEGTRQEFMNDALSGLGDADAAMADFAGSASEIAQNYDSGGGEAAPETVDTLDTGGTAATTKSTSGGGSGASSSRTTSSSAQSTSSSSSVDGIGRAEQELLSDQDAGVLGENAYDYWDNDFGFAQAGVHGDDNINAEGGFIEGSKEAGSLEEAAFNQAYTSYLAGEQERDQQWGMAGMEHNVGRGADPSWMTRPDPEAARKGYGVTRSMIENDVFDGRIDSESAAMIADANPEALIDPMDWKNAVADHEREQERLLSEEAFALKEDERREAAIIAADMDQLGMERYFEAGPPEDATKKEKEEFDQRYDDYYGLSIDGTFPTLIGFSDADLAKAKTNSTAARLTR
tara:strand:- start:5155 stop:6747 length:1593 start_codon:yes stop_codon:yes gene_type:complete